MFQETHGLALRLLGQDKVNGFRIDHPDGLYDPVAYFGRLQERYLRAALQKELGVGDVPELAEQVAQWVRSRASVQKREGCPWPFFVVAEKILSETEPLPLDWAVCGTTGYDFLASSNGLFVNPANAQEFTNIYEHFVGEAIDFDEMALGTQRLIMDTALSSEINELSHEIERIGERNRHCRDFTLNNLRDAVSEVIACLPVYRTYINAETGAITDRDRNFIIQRGQSPRRAAARTSTYRSSSTSRIRCSWRTSNTFPEQAREALRHWVMKFQQMTGPVMAKGVEDTAFYRYNRLVSLNEVGGHPLEFGTTVDAFHAANRLRAEHWPHGMLTTSTHDNKRSEDVRARLDVLSEMPQAWQQALAAWSEINAASAHAAGGRHLCARPQRRIPAVPDDPRHVAAGVRRGRVLRPVRSRARPRAAAASGASSGTPPLAPHSIPTVSGSPPTCRRRSRKQRSTAAGSTRTRRMTRRCATSWRSCSRPSRATASSKHSRRSRGESLTSGSSTRSAKCCSSSPRPACPTFTRATSYGTSAWWTRTTGARWTMTGGAAPWPRFAAASRP